MRRARIVAASVLTLVCLVAATHLLRMRARAAEGAAYSRGLLAALGRELGAAPSISARLSIATHRPCTPAAGEDGCTGTRSPAQARRIGRIAARAGQALRMGDDPEAMHAAAIIDVLYETGEGKSLERAIYSLRTVSRTVERPAPVLSDLAAAYLVRAERAAAPRDLLAAIDVAEDAVAREPGYLPARYNLALALQRFGLVEQAAKEWETYLAADPRSGWGREAGRHLRDASASAGLPVPPPLHAPVAAFAAYASADPLGARHLGWDRVLDEWAAAVLAGTPVPAEGYLARAAALGETLESRPGGDATLADAVRAIRSSRSEAETRRLAMAHREYAVGIALYDAAQRAAAEPHLRLAVEAASSSSALRGWARLFHANVRVYAGEWQGAERTLLALAAEADTVRHPAYAARLRWSIAATRVRTERYDRALQPAEESARLFARAGEREYEAAVLSILADAYFVLGDVTAGYATWHRAVDAVRAYRTSLRLHGLLVAIAGAAAKDGLYRAAVRVQDEGVTVTLRRGDPLRAAEARLARARLLSATGGVARARQDVDFARAALKGVPAEAMGWMGADLQVAEAVTSLAEGPAAAGRAAAALDSAVTLFTSSGAPLRAFPAVVSAAEARLVMGDMVGAAGRLEIAMAMLERRRDSTRMEPRRAAVFNAARGVVDRVVMLHLAAQRPDEALRYMDRGRASLAPAGREPSGRPARLEAPPDEVGVEYAMVGDTLLAWTVAGREVSVSRTPLDSTELARTGARLRSLLQQGQADPRAVEATLAQLYDWLVRPVKDRLGGSGRRLVIVADGELAAVPFAALRDTRRGRYLVQDHPLRFAVSLREAWAAPRSTGRVETVVLVADPAFALGEHPALQRLPGAAAEVRAIGAEYPHSRVVADRQATPAAVEAALAGAGVVHYAGHAVFDDERPERSYLVLAPPAGHTVGGRLAAEELARMELEHAPLVVLAACRSVNAGPGRASGFTGLAGGLLAAGARGVVGGLWEVDDGRTRPLMVEFHRAYQRVGDGPGALRAAQLQMMRSSDPTLRSPFSWAGFRYAGR